MTEISKQKAMIKACTSFEHNVSKIECFLINGMQYETKVSDFGLYISETKLSNERCLRPYI